MPNNPQKKCEHKNIGIVGNYKYCGDCSLSVSPTQPDNEIRRQKEIEALGNPCKSKPTQPDCKSCESYYKKGFNFCGDCGSRVKGVADPSDTEYWEEDFFTLWKNEIIVEGNNGHQPTYTLNHGINAFAKFIRQEKEKSYRKGVLHVTAMVKKMLPEAWFPAGASSIKRKTLEEVLSRINKLSQPE